jgi:hypothetical protein
MALPVLYLFRIPVRNLAELRARATAEFDLIYIRAMRSVKRKPHHHLRLRVKIG